MFGIRGVGSAIHDRGISGMNEREELIRKTIMIIQEIFQKATGTVSHCRSDMEWQFNHLRGYGVYCSHIRNAIRSCKGPNEQIRHRNYYVRKIAGQVYIVSGTFCIGSNQSTDQDGETPYEIVVCMCNGMAEYIHIYGSKSARLLCEVQGLNGVTYFPEETEVLYIESAHNNVIWHCRAYEVESRDSLKRLEQCLPEIFMRIQRGYIVNVNHIHSIRKNELEMDNGDVLTIPYRIYTNVKEGIMHKMQRLRKDR